jgi:hypothetical protein
MAKKSIKARKGIKVGTPVDMNGFPQSISDEANEQMKELMGRVLETLPEGVEVPMPTHLNIHFLSEEGTGRWMSLFVLADPGEEVSDDIMRVEAAMDFQTLRRVASEGQEPMWEWMRNVAAMTCVQAVIHGEGLPNRIGIQLSNALRAHDVDSDPEFTHMINETAKQVAMRSMMSRVMSE